MGSGGILDIHFNIMVCTLQVLHQQEQEVIGTTSIVNSNPIRNGRVFYFQEEDVRLQVGEQSPTAVEKTLTLFNKINLDMSNISFIFVL